MTCLPALRIVLAFCGMLLPTLAPADVRVEITEAALGNFASAIEIEGDRVTRVEARMPCLPQMFAAIGDGGPSGSPAAGDDGDETRQGIGVTSEFETLRVLDPSALDRIGEIRRMFEGTLEIRECVRETRVPWSWRVVAVDADIGPGGAVLRGVVEVAAGTYRGRRGFEIPLDVSFNRIRSSLEIEARRTPIRLQALLMGELRDLGSIEFSNHYTAEIPLSGRVRVSGRVLTPKADDVSVVFRNGSIVLTGGIRF